MRKKISLILCVIIMAGILSLPANAAQKIFGAARVNTESTALNVRSAPSSTASVKAKVRKNDLVTLISKSGDYWYIRYNSTGYGYTHKDYLKGVSSAVRTVKTTSGKLRVRESASLNAQTKAYLSSGTQVVYLEQSGSFYKILYNGNATGYVHKNYLVKEDSFTSNYKAISLNVPDYKQYDSRWANVTLGTSGQTMKNIGCATTALAMTQSYKESKNIYPHIMESRLSYTSGGAVYWPASYNIITSSSGYLEKIYSALSQGKPVIVGAKKANGSQHYVVVTGVKATDTLSTSAFYINDPGSETRVTLNQFFNAYPNFYKMLYVK